MKTIQARAFDPGFAEGDCAYQGIVVAPDGHVYFAIGTNQHGTHARLIGFAPGRDESILDVDIGALVHDKGQALPHGKVHVPLTVIDNTVWFATMQAHDARGAQRYPGFAVVGLDLDSGSPAHVVRGPSGEGLVAAIVDTDRLVMHGLTYPGNRRVRYPLGSDHLEMLPRPCRELPIGGRLRGRFIYPVCRALTLDAEGAVYGTNRRGSIWRAGPDDRRTAWTGLTLDSAITQPADRTGRTKGQWRTVVREADGVSIGLHAGTRSLFRFDPRAGRVVTLGRMGAATGHRDSSAPIGTQLGLALGPDRRAYHLSHERADASDPPGSPQAVVLTSRDIDRDDFFEHGRLVTDSGDPVLFAESLACAPSGELYTVAWVGVTDPATREDFARRRTESSPSLSRGLPYRMLLLRLDASAVGRRT